MTPFTSSKIGHQRRNGDGMDIDEDECKTLTDEDNK